MRPPTLMMTTQLLTSHERKRRNVDHSRMGMDGNGAEAMTSLMRRSTIRPCSGKSRWTQSARKRTTSRTTARRLAAMTNARRIGKLRAVATGWNLLMQSCGC